MTDSELARIIDLHIKDALSLGEMTEDQADALDYYYGRPYGNEIEGQSQVVTREVMETIEWAMPSLMRIFASERAVEFDPVGPDDVEQADQETDAIRHVAWKYSDGFSNTYNWCKDGLLQRVGYAKVFVEESEETVQQSFEGLSDADLLTFPEDSIISLDRVDLETEIGTLTTYNATVEITQTKKKVKWDVVEPEHIRISKRVGSVNLDNSDFTAHIEEYTQSDLLEMGFDESVVKSLPSYTGAEADTDSLDYARSTHSGEDYDGESWAEEAMRPIEVWECYVKTDLEDTGIAQLAKVMYAGGRVLSKEPVDFVPIIAWSPLPMPHQHAGLSLADVVMDLQKIRSTLMRQVLDNLYLTNNPEKEVVWDNVEVPADLMQSLPGGIKRVSEPGTINPLMVPFTAGASIPIMEMLDAERNERTGVSRHTMGLDADTLAQSTKGAFLGAMEQANGRLELIARHFAETGLKHLYIKLHALMIKEFDEELRINLGGEFVGVSPSQWRRREDLTVKVGTGNTSVEQRALLASQVLDVQERIVAAGGMGRLVTEENVYNAATDFVEAIGKTNGDRYFTDGSKLPPQEPQQDMQSQLIAAQLQVEQMKAQMQAQKNQIDALKSQQDVELKQQQMMLEAQSKEQDRVIKMEEIRQRQVSEAQKAELEQYKVRLAEAEAQLESAADGDKVAMQKYVADLRAQTDVQIEQMRIAASEQSEDRLASERAELRVVEKEKASAQSVEVSAPTPVAPEIHIHQGGKKKITVKRNDDGSLEGETEDVE